MNDPNGPYSANDVAHLNAKQKKRLKKEARDFALNSKELLKIIFGQKALREEVFKNRKVREVIKKELQPTFRRLTADK
jgi:dephospho-CoA kinase